MCPLWCGNSNARSGRENISGGGCDPPPPHGIGVGGVRQHSSRAAGYDGSGLRDRAAVDLHTTPRMERERENGEIIEGGNESPPYHQDPPPDTIPIFKVGQCSSVCSRWRLDWIRTNGGCGGVI